MKNLISIFTTLLILLSSDYAMAQIRGRVVNEQKLGVAGATIENLKSNIKTITGQDGQFAIEGSAGHTIFVSHAQFESKKIVIQDGQPLEIILQENLRNIEEVVAIGYGTVKKKDLTGAVVSIDVEQLNNSKVGTATSALQGLASGVYVTTGSVKPGGDATVIIRGQGSINAGNSPLYIIDGLPVEGGLQDLSPQDIESIDVLKDASAASIYGSRGSNGVVLITTKKGRSGEGKLSFLANYGTQRMLNKQNLMDATQYFELANTANSNYQWTSDELRWISKGETTDWQDAVTQNGRYNNYNLSLSGGSDKVTHMLAVDWYDQIGTIKNSSFNKGSVRFNMDAQLKDWIKSGIRFNVINSNLKNINEEQDSGYGTMFSAISSQPTAPIFLENGAYFDGFLNTKANPVAMVDLLDKITKKSKVMGNFFFELQPIANLTFRSENGGDLEFFNVNSYEDGRMGQHYPDGGHATKFNGKRMYIQSENTFNYRYQLEAHRFDAMVGASVSRVTYENTTADSKNLNPILKYNNLGGAENHGPNSSYAVNSSLVSFYGRLNYSLQDKYLATINLRRDGSSKFAPNNRWSFFPSASVAWKVSSEEFLKDSPLLSNLKIRASVGQLGNQNIGDFAFAATISEGGYWSDYVLGNNVATGSVQNTISNPELTWEKSQQIDLGIDFGLWNNRLTGNIDLYHKNTRDLLFSVPLPRESGFENSLTNVGKVINKGIEIGLNSLNISSGKFSWQTTMNFTYNQNRVTELYNNKQDINKWLFVGRTINQFYMLKSQGIWQESEASEAARYNAQPGDRKILDLDGNGIINSDDRTFTGESVPKYYGSLGNTFRYKDIDLNIFFVYAGGHMIDNALNRYLHAFNPWGNMSQDYYNGYWTFERPSNIFPAPRLGSPFANGDGTDAHLQRGDYLRLKNIELGYSFSPSIFNSKVKSLRVFFSAQNLLTFTEFTGFDVESSDKVNPYPNARTFIGGIALTL